MGSAPVSEVVWSSPVPAEAQHGTWRDPRRTFFRSFCWSTIFFDKSREDFCESEAAFWFLIRCLDNKLETSAPGLAALADATGAP